MPGRSAARAFAAAHLSDSREQHAALTTSQRRRPLDTFFPFDPYLLRRSAAQLDLKRSYIKCARLRVAWLAARADGRLALLQVALERCGWPRSAGWLRQR
jgi:hypothetical protein